MNSLLHEWWAQIVALAASVAWLARLEARANRNTDDLTRLEMRLSEQRREDKADRDRDWGRMLKSMDEMQADIKKLLERHG